MYCSLLAGCQTTTIFEKWVTLHDRKRWRCLFKGPFTEYQPLTDLKKDLFIYTEI